MFWYFYPILRFRNQFIFVMPEYTTLETAFVLQSTACMRLEPRHAAELVSQVGGGFPVTVLTRNASGWAQITSPEGYTGWVEPKALSNHLSELYSLPEVKPGFALIRLDYGFVPVYKRRILPEEVNFVAGNLVRTYTIKNGKVFILFPSGLPAEWPAKDLLPVLNPRVTHPENEVDHPLFSVQGLEEAYSVETEGGNSAYKPAFLIPCAAHYIGVPYLWGGNTPRGFDCSGLVQFCFLFHGFLFPRDAAQQALVGEEVDISGKNLGNLIPGDLLFFGEETGKITHVGLYKGKGLYIHASGAVRINSLIESDPLYEPYRYNTWQSARRIGRKHITALSKVLHEQFGL